MSAVDHKSFEVEDVDREAILAKSVLSNSDIFALKDEWIKLEKECPNSVLFQSFAWCANYLEFVAGNSAINPLVVTLRQGGELIGLLPLSIQNNNGLKLITGLTEPYQQYTEILLSNKVDADDVAIILLQELKKSKVDYFHSGQVRLGSALAKILDKKAKRVGEQDAAPFVRLTDWPDFDSYFKSVKAKTRKNMRNARNRLSREAEISHQSGTTGALLGTVIDRTYEGREAWLERLGITSRAFRNSDFKGFLDRFKNTKITNVNVLAMSLKHGDAPMSDQWGFVYRGRYYAFMATWHEDYEAQSPGKLHLAEVVETCYEQGIDVADFMIPASSYKFTWTDEATPVCDYVYSMSWRGWIQCNIWLGLVRPIAKKLVQKIPTGLRGFLISKLLAKAE